MATISHIEGFDQQYDLNRITAGGGGLKTQLLNRKAADTVNGQVAGGQPLSIPAGVPATAYWMYYAMHYGHLDNQCAFTIGPQRNAITQNEAYANRDFYWYGSLGGASGGAPFNPTARNWNGTLSSDSNVQPVGTPTSGRWKTDVIDQLNNGINGHDISLFTDCLGQRGGASTGDITWPGHDVIAAWNPGGPNDTVPRGALGANTQYVDDCLVAWANLMKTVPRMTMYRLWHEMGNGIYADSGNWGRFQTNWRKIVGYLRQLGGLSTNQGLDGLGVVAWVPASHGDNPSDDFEKYPGGDVVDIIGRDLYVHDWEVKDAAQLWYDRFHPDMGDGLGSGPGNPENRPLVAFEGGMLTSAGGRDPAALAKITELFDRMDGTFPDNGQPPLSGGVPNPAHDGPWPGLSGFMWWNATRQVLSNADPYQTTFRTRLAEPYFIPDGLTTEPGGAAGTDGMAYDTAVVHHAHTNSASLRVINPTAATNWSFNCVGTNPVCVTSFAFRFHVFPAAQSRILRFQDTTATGVGHDIVIGTAGAMKFQVGGAGAGATGGTISLDTWYILECKVDVTGTSHSMTWKVYPAGLPGSPTVAERTDTAVGQTASFVLNCAIGLGATTTSPCHYNLDDWVVSEVAGDYPLGEHFCKVYKPTGKGVHIPGAGAFKNFAGAAITDGSPQNSHLDLDDIPGIGTTGVRQTVADAAGYLEYLMSSATENATPDCVRLVGAFVPQSVATNNWDMRIRETGTLSPSMACDPSAQAGAYEYHCSTFPRTPTGTTWSNAKLQNTVARVGFSTLAANAPSMTELMLGASFQTTTTQAVVGGVALAPLRAFGGTAAGGGGTTVTGGVALAPLRAFGGTANIGGGTVGVAVPSLAAVDSGTLDIMLGVADGVHSFTPQSDFTEKADVVQNLAGLANDQTIFIAYRVVSAGATGAVLGDLDSTAAWAAMHLLITPSPVILTVFTPTGDITVGGHEGDIFTVSGNATIGEDQPVVTVNGDNQTLDGVGNFNSPLPLGLGANLVTVVAAEPGGAQRTVTIQRTITVVEPDPGGGGSSDPAELSGDMLRIQRVIKESSLDPR